MNCICHSQQADLESVKLLVALGADVNLPDLYGKTPLNIARLKSERKLPDADTSTRMQTIKSDHAMLFESRETWDTRFTETGEGIVSSMHDRIEVGKYLEICRALESVGALPARILDPPSPAPKQPKRGMKNGVEDFTGSCEVYRQLEKSTTQKIQDINFSPTPQQAMELVRQLQREAEYRRRFGSRILCLDGGGMRGLVQIEILRQIEKKTGKRITELFDWIVGTSIGGIIALALVYGKLRSVHSTENSMTDMCCTMQRILTQNDMKFMSKKMSPRDFMCSPSLRVWQVSLFAVIDFRLSCHVAHHAFNPAVVSTIGQTKLICCCTYCSQSYF